VNENSLKLTHNSQNEKKSFAKIQQRKLQETKQKQKINKTTERSERKNSYDF